MCVCACVHAFVCVCVSLCRQPYLSETSEAIAITFDTVTASVTRMHHMLFILTLTFIQGHTDFNHENNKCLIILQTVQAMPIKFAVKIVRQKVIVIIKKKVTVNGCVTGVSALTVLVLVIVFKNHTSTL